MAVKPRKTLLSWQAPCIQPLMRLIQTQSKATVVNWCIDYTEEHILPVYEKAYPKDGRPRSALDAARSWMAGQIKLPQVKRIILNECHAAAREAESHPAAQAAARCCGQAAASIHAPRHAMALAFYGTAAIAYDRVGVEAAPEVYDQIAMAACAQMEAALLAVAVKDEPNPVNIKWHC